MEKWKKELYTEFGYLEKIFSDASDTTERDHLLAFIEKVRQERYKEGYERGIREVINEIPDVIANNGEEAVSSEALKAQLKAKFL